VPLPIRTIRPDEVDAALACLMVAFGQDPAEPVPWRDLVEPERTLIAEDAGAVVGTASALSFRFSVPGGGELPTAAVTMVGVRPTHRRRGLLNGFMGELLADARRRGEPLAALWASESSIYGRFGFGVAARMASIEIERAHARLAAGETAAARAALVALDEAPGRIGGVYEGLRRSRAGVPDRSPDWWRLHRLRDEERHREGGGPLTCVVVEVEGESAAYALYRVHDRWEHGSPSGSVDVAEAVSLTPASTRALWAYLLSLDLTATVRADVPVDHPLRHIVADARRLRPRVSDGLWARLVDLPEAVAGRGYAGEGAVVVEVADPLCPENAGRWRVEARGGEGRAVRVGDPPDLVLGVGALSAAWFGGVSLVELVDAGLVGEAAAGAAERATALFRAARAPWCPEIF
jgi:predicted acetyltransferase